ncbi:hypothetical protein F1559_000710 [Cyanidiococcus yangmingshanensis]|uniref:Endonuclease/exonuclease/phosphatase domain-containing protein n=1 Tax=Cyanidiococcus yangmingshanensis TaxID=2690220 RepID=A0A7J7INY7_9RHOD|nr:hypothetical protein F1559_000710 [Cyanidiococcus yangmingshanensis]
MKSSSPQERNRTSPLHFSFLTFNLLAPCYAVRPPAVCARSGSSAVAENAPEWLDPQHWRNRAEHLCAFLCTDNGATPSNEKLERMLSETLAEIICLQEYTFEPAFEELFQRWFPESTFQWIKAKRPGKKRDGLVILFRRHHFRVHGWQCFALNPLGDRIGLLVHLVPIRAPHVHLFVANVHLTFPHHPWDTLTRKLQARTIHRVIPRYRLAVLCGDWNTLSLEDPILEYLETVGYSRCRLPERTITHLTHDGRQICCDHIFIDGAQQNVIAEAQLLPPDLRHDEWPQADVYDLSDHRPVRVELTLESERCSL